MFEFLGILLFLQLFSPNDLHHLPTSLLKTYNVLMQLLDLLFLSLIFDTFLTNFTRVLRHFFL